MFGRSTLVFLLVSLQLGLTQGSAGAGAHVPQTTLRSGEFTAEVNGLRLWYRISGRGPVCLMPAPGWGPSSDLYFRTLKPLEKLFTVVYLDTRGTGRSERAKAVTEYTWDHLIGDLDALRTYLKQDKVWMMGHSEGGMQIMHYACKYPERVSGLILLATQAITSRGDGLAMMTRAMRWKNEPWFAEAVKAAMTAPKTDEEMAASIKKILPLYWADPKRIEKHQEHFAATSMSVDARRGMQACRTEGFDLTGDLKKVTAPTLIVVGDKDIICPPSAARQIHLSLPNSKLLLLEGAGHFAWLEQAEEFNAQAPRFLAALGLR